VRVAMRIGLWKPFLEEGAKVRRVLVEGHSSKFDFSKDSR